MPDLGEKLSALRRRAGLSQKELAERLALYGVHVTNQAVSKWEKGLTQPGAEQFLALCRALDVENIGAEFLGRRTGMLRDLNDAGVRKLREYADLLRASGLYSLPTEQHSERVLPLYTLAVSAGTRLIWDILPQRTGLGWLTVPLCALGGPAMGLLRRRFGDYPEDLATVMGKVRREKHYDYRPMAVILLCALLPLIFGASVGPEAGLTGIVTALCYWVGDNVTYAKRNAALYSELGKAVALGQIFHAPLFGILAVEEEPGEKPTAGV